MWLWLFFSVIKAPPIVLVMNPIVLSIGFIRYMLLGDFAFYYDGYKGRYEFLLQDDKTVQKSLEILLDDALYSSILTAPEEKQIALTEN